MKRSKAGKISENEEELFVEILQNLYLKSSKKDLNLKFIEYVNVEILKDKEEKIIKISRIGDDYSNLGDVEIITDKRKIILELKYGRDTLANISENAITQENYGFFENALSWSEFREKNNFNKKIIDFIIEYDENIDRTLLEKRSKLAEFIRTLKLKLGESNKNTETLIRKAEESGEFLDIVELFKKIIHLANKNKEDYINYLKENENLLNTEKMEDFFYKVLLGITPSRNKKYSNHEYYYLTPNKMERILFNNKKDNNGFFIEYRKQDIIIGNNKIKLKLVFHWKNVMQGIQTPCLNVFKEEL